MFKYLQEIMDTKSEWIRNLSRKKETKQTKKETIGNSRPEKHYQSES